MILEAVLEVATPVIFGVGIIILVFLPLMTLQGMEGKMFAPLAYTIAIALAISLAISLTLSPALASFMLKGGAEHDTWLIRTIKTALPAPARLGARKREEDRRRRGGALRRDARGRSRSSAPRSSRR